MPIPKLTAEILTAAIEGFESQKRRIDDQIGEIRQMLNGSRAEPASAAEPQKRQRRKMSAAGRKAIAEAQRKRWAALKAESAPPSKTTATKSKRKLSPAGRAAIVAALKKRWAAKRAASPAVKKVAVKKAAPRKATAKALTASQ